MAAVASPSPFSYLSFFLYIFLITAASSSDPYTPTDYILLNCGSSTDGLASSLDRRRWDADSTPIFYPSNSPNASFPASPSGQDPSVDQVPYMTARLISQNFSYSFPVSPGLKFLRLYFYPATYSSGLNLSASFFTVTANGYTLLSNFSAYLTASAENPPASTVVKEYMINVGDSQRLNITFAPLPNSYAFVNGIEIVSTPDNLYVRGERNPLTWVRPQQSTYIFYLNNDYAFETLYRLNVGGNDLQVTNDTGMYRAWKLDEPYVVGGTFLPHLDVPINYTASTPAYSAPVVVYTTSRTMSNYSHNLTWSFSVDSGFYYFIRLHFCEFQMEITRQNDRVFTIMIDGEMAEPQFDVVFWSGGLKTPVFRDYVIWIPPVNGGQKRDVWLLMRPNMDSRPRYASAILNGLEMFKMSDASSRNLASPNPQPQVVRPSNPVVPSRTDKKGKGPGFIAGVIGGVVGGIALVSTVLFLILRRRKTSNDSGKASAKHSWIPLLSSKTIVSDASTLPSDLCRHFSLEEIKTATGNFDDNFVIGSGGFGKVYRGYIDNGTTTVAIKRLSASSNQGAREFQTEIEMLSKLRHFHLVSLIGYCDETGEMILVYDYMGRGTLRDHLYKTDNPTLPWKTRLEVSIGAAKGLHYLHTGAKHVIIHRDVKSTNILLDEKWVARVSDFGLSKVGPLSGTDSHISTMVKGSFGYVDPEYYRLQRLTEKSDVYSFGVVLFEVLCGRPAVMQSLPKDQVSLAEWARRCYRNGSINQIVDPHLKDQIAPESLEKYKEVAYQCLKDHGSDRPTMNDVVWSLEFALQLQEAAEKRGAGERKELPLLFHEATTTDDDEMFSSSKSRSLVEMSTTTTSTEKFNSENVFSEIHNPSGR